MPRCIYLRIGKSQSASSAPPSRKRWGWRGWTEALICSGPTRNDSVVDSNRGPSAGIRKRRTSLRQGWTSQTTTLVTRELPTSESHILPRHKGSARQGALAGAAFQAGRSSGPTRLSVFLNSHLPSSFNAHDFGARSSAGLPSVEMSRWPLPQGRRNWTSNIA